MTEETAAVQRLDYSKPPLGYEVGNRADEDERLVIAEQGEGLWSHRIGGITPWAWNDPTALGLESCGDADSQVEALAGAWGHYKAHNDPPGMCVFVWPREKAGDPPTAWCVALHGQPHFTAFTEPEADACRPDAETQARAAAWAWYDRRLVLWHRLAQEQAALMAVLVGCSPTWHSPDCWPHCLAWTDEQVADVERWLGDSTAELPKVLGEEEEESGHVCTGCIGDGPCVVLEAEIEGEERDADEIAELEAEIDDEDEFMDDGLCSPMPRSESGDPTGRDWSRQVEEHNATTLSLLNFNEPPPGWIWIGEDHDQGCALAEGASSMLDLLPFALPRAWERYKLSHDPPGMWCGFSRAVDDLDNCSIRVGVHACGSRWELQPDLNVPYTGFTVTARAWAWAWYERRQVLMEKLAKTVADLREPNQHPLALAVSLILTNRAPFHRVLCWHNEWVDEVEAWIERPSSTVPEALR